MSGWDQKHDQDEEDGDEQLYIIVNLVLVMAIGVLLIVLDATGTVPIFALVGLSGMAMILWLDAVRRMR